MSHFPEEIIVNIISFLPMTAKVKVMRVNQRWKRIAESSLTKQETLAVVSERPYASRRFACCFGCHVTPIPHLNVLGPCHMYSINRWKIQLKRYCPNISVLVVEDRMYGQWSSFHFPITDDSLRDRTGSELLHEYRETLESLSFPGLVMRDRYFPRLKHVETIMHEYGSHQMQTVESIRQALPSLQCMNLSHLRFFLSESVLPVGIRHLCLLGGNSLAALSESPAAATLERLDYEEGFKIVNLVDMDFRFPALRAFWFEDTPAAGKFKNIVHCLIRSRNLESLRFYVSIGASDDLVDDNLPNIWKFLFIHTTGLTDFLLHSLAYDTYSLGFDDDVVKCLVRSCPGLKSISIYDKDDTLTDVTIDELSKLRNLQSLQIESKNSLFTRAAVSRFLRGSSRHCLRKVRITGQRRQEKIYTEHTLVRSYMGGNEWRVACLKDGNKSKKRLLEVVINEQMDVDADFLQRDIDALRNEFKLKECEVTGTID